VTVSIRKFLLINLLLAITITTTLTAIGNYYLDQKDIQRHLDTLMVMTTLSYQSLLGSHITQKNVDEIQEALNQIPSVVERYHHQQYVSLPSERFADRFNFQVWTDDGHLILHSPNAPDMSLATNFDGFSDRVINSDLWRVFTMHHPDGKFRTVVGERYDTRNELGHRIAQDDLYIMLLTFPLSGLLIWIIIGKGLDSLSRVTNEVSSRAPTFLEPVDIYGVPEEIKPLIDELNKLFLRLQQAFEREKRFAADAAHELRTPLAALKTQAQVALKTTDVEERRTALQNVITGVNRSTHIIQQLLTMSRLVPEATLIEESDSVNLTKLAAEIIATLVPMAMEKSIDIELDSSDNHIMVQGNVTALSILIRNLVDNAIRYTPNHGRVSIDVSENDDNILLTVADNGPGIPAELRARVFERFFRVLGNKSPGSGLGLAIVQQIAKLHQAAVKLGAPTEGSGLVVEIAFPKPKSLQSS